MSIREDQVLIRQNNILEVLALSNNYHIIFNKIIDLANMEQDGPIVDPHPDYNQRLRSGIDDILNTLLIDLYINIKNRGFKKTYNYI